MNTRVDHWEKDHSKHGKISAVLLGLLIAFVSSGFVQKYTGTAGLAIYAIIVMAVILLIERYLGTIESLIRPRFRILAAIIFCALFTGFLGLHHIEDDRGPGRSSDRDEGLELAVSRLLNGENPYYPQNDLAGPLSLLPGAIFLSIPFVLIGSVGLQNVFWLGVFLFISIRHFGNRTLALVLLVVFLAISPSAQYEFVSGGDIISNGIYVAAFLMLACHFWNKDSSLSGKLISAFLLAVGLASRANFILLLPLFGAFVWHESGIRRALAAVSLVVLSYLVIVLPFYLYDPSAFTPLISQDKLSYAGQSTPWINKAIIGVTFLVCAGASGWLAFARRESGMGMLFRCAALVTLLPMICVVIHASIIRGRIDFYFMNDRFGLMYMFLALLGWGSTLTSRAPLPANLPEPS